MHTITTSYLGGQRRWGVWLVLSDFKNRNRNGPSSSGQNARGPINQNNSSHHLFGEAKRAHARSHTHTQDDLHLQKVDTETCPIHLRAKHRQAQKTRRTPVNKHRLPGSTGKSYSEAQKSKKKKHAHADKKKRHISLYSEAETAHHTMAAISLRLIVHTRKNRYHQSHQKNNMKRTTPVTTPKQSMMTYLLRALP